MKGFLGRTDLKSPLKQVLAETAENYSIGKVLKWKIIRMGYDDLNIKLSTKNGIYIVKIFSKLKTEKIIQDYAKTLTKLSHIGVPAPELVKGKSGLLYKVQGKKKCSHIFVMKFFFGRNFEKVWPTKYDIITLIKYLARLHKKNFKVCHNYDSWGTANLLKEFSLKKKFLRLKDLKSILPVLDQFKKIKFSKFKRCAIHGDVQRKHVLKNFAGEYCIIDWGTLDYNAAVLDLAIFIALFCFDPRLTPARNRKIFEFAVRAYLKLNRLSKAEIDIIPLLVKATYAIYIIAAYYAFSVENDKSYQTKQWLSFSRRCLKISNSIWVN